MTREELIKHMESAVDFPRFSEWKGLAAASRTAAAMLRADGEEIERLRKERDEGLKEVGRMVDVLISEQIARICAEKERDELRAAQRMRPMSELTGDDGEVFIWSRDRRYPFIANYRAYGALNANSEHVQAIIGWTPIPPMPSAPEDGK